jgi:hypothetical protein
VSPFSMAYGAVFSAVLAVVLLAYATKQRRRSTLVTAAVAALVMPVAWNIILRITGATSAFSHDLPFRPFPVSWQDVGTAVFTLAGAAVAFAATSPDAPARRALQLASWTAVAAFVVDIYLY